jgi:hypothetical protein
MGRTSDARKVLADLQEQSKKGYVAPANFAKIYIGLGDKDQAFTWLEKGYQQHDFWITSLKGEPVFDSLRSDLRFQDLVRRVNFPKQLLALVECSATDQGGAIHRRPRFGVCGRRQTCSSAD